MEQITASLDYYVNEYNASDDGIISILDLHCYECRILIKIYYVAEFSNYFINCQFDIISVLAIGNGDYTAAYTTSTDTDTDIDDLLCNCMYSKTPRALTLPCGRQIKLHDGQYDDFCEILEHMQENNWKLPALEEVIERSAAFSAGLK